MARRPPGRVVAQASISTPQGSDPAVLERAVSDLARDLGELQGVRVLQGVTLVADLAPGMNRVSHGLGRAPVNVQVTPTVLDAGWAWAWREAITANPQQQIWIETTGPAQPRARIFVY